MQCGGWVRQICHVSYITRASNWYWLTVGQGLLSLQHIRIEGGMFLFLLFLCFHSFSFFPCPSLSSLLSFFLLSLDDTKWHTRVDVSLNPNTINNLCKLGKHHVLNYIQPQRFPGFGEVFKYIYNIWAWWPSWLTLLTIKTNPHPTLHRKINMEFGPAVSEKVVNDVMILFMYIDYGEGQTALRGQSSDCFESFATAITNTTFATFCLLSCTSRPLWKGILTHCRLNRFPRTIYWKSLISISDTSCYDI